MHTQYSTPTGESLKKAASTALPFRNDKSL